MFKKTKDYFSLACPSCAKETKVRASGDQGSHCAHCETSFLGLTFIRRKTLSTGLLALSCLLGGAGAHEVMSDTRLPVIAEYRFMEMCLNGDDRVVDEQLYANKEVICSCIVTKAIEDIDLTWKTVSGKKFDRWFFESMLEAGPQCQ